MIGHACSYNGENTEDERERERETVCVVDEKGCCFERWRMDDNGDQKQDEWTASPAWPIPAR